MPAAPHAPWENPRILFTLLLIFLCGALAGSIVMRYGFRAESANLLHPWPEPGQEISIDRLRAELDLSPQQTKELELIVDDFTNYIHSLQAQMDDVRATGKRRIQSILNEEQKNKFERMLGEAHQKTGVD